MTYKAPTRYAVAVSQVTVMDPDSNAPVDVQIYKDRATGGMFGIDASYLMLSDPEDLFTEPFNNKLIALIDDKPVPVSFDAVVDFIRLAFDGKCYHVLFPDVLSQWDKQISILDDAISYKASRVEILTQWTAFKKLESFKLDDGTVLFDYLIDVYPDGATMDQVYNSMESSYADLTVIDDLVPLQSYTLHAAQ
jgi:hypothetical protein